MKKVNLMYLFGVLGLMIALSISSCTKEGPAGKDGLDGEDGIDGQDGTATCIQCHDDSQVIFAKSNQWEHSIHATGGNYERNGEDCATCHTSQGFLERMAAGVMTLDAPVSNPNPVNCYTCHNIHETFTPEDWALTYAEPVELWHPPAKVTIDLGTGNLCANCHQSRVVNPWPVVGSSDTYTITSYRYGPHHGPMSNVLVGEGGYEVPGSLTYTNSMHTGIENACVTCHMADAFGVELGGHVMNVGYNGSINESGCVECHPDGIEDATHEVQEEVHALLEQLGNKLIDLAVMDSTGYLLGDNGTRASSSNPANLSADEAGAFFNYKMIEEDRSFGLHNIKYTKALLTNSFEAINE